MHIPALDALTMLKGCHSGSRFKEQRMNQAKIIKITLHRTLDMHGNAIEYVRIFSRSGRTHLGQSVLLSRLSSDQRNRLREECKA